MERTERWRRELDLIEEQHGILEQEMAELLEVVRQGRPPIEVDRKLAQIIQRLEEHFRHEEVLMSRAAYPELHPHRLLHQSCLGQLREERDHLALRGPRDLAVYREHTQVWIRNHMERQDQRFESYLRRLDGGPEAADR